MLRPDRITAALAEDPASQDAAADETLDDPNNFMQQIDFALLADQVDMSMLLDGVIGGEEGVSEGEGGVSEGEGEDDMELDDDAGLSPTLPLPLPATIITPPLPAAPIQGVQDWFK